MEISNRTIWLNGELVNVNDAKINVLSTTSQFGANVFEGIRCYWNEKDQQLYAFRLKEHYDRLHRSIKMFRMESKYTTEDFEKSLKDVIKANNYKEDTAVRQTVFLDGMGSWMSTGPVGMFVAPIPKARTINFDEKIGFTAQVSSWERISDKNLSPKVKVGANYINSRMAQIEATTNGYDTAIFMNNQGKVSEGPGSCLFIVRDDVLITPPLSASVLESITRETIIELAREELGMKVIEREVDRTELYICDEAFLTGSAMEVTPIINVDGYIVGDGEFGKHSKNIFNLYLDVVRGNIKKYKKWLTPVY